MTTRTIHAVTDSVLIPAAGAPLRGDLLPFLARRSESWPSRMAAAAAGTARGTASWPRSCGAPPRDTAARSAHRRRGGGGLDDRGVCASTSRRLAERLTAVVDWLGQGRDTRALPAGRSERVRARPRRWWRPRTGPPPSRPSCPRGGRPDLAGRRDAPRARTHAVDRRRLRRAGHRAESRGDAADHLRSGARHRAWRHTLVRETRRPRARRRARWRMVSATPAAAAEGVTRAFSRDSPGPPGTPH